MEFKKNYLSVGSPVDYEELVVYFIVEGREIALLQKEEGSDKMAIEFFFEDENKKVYLDEFLIMIQRAKNELLL